MIDHLTDDEWSYLEGRYEFNRSQFSTVGGWAPWYVTYLRAVIARGKHSDRVREAIDRMAERARGTEMGVGQ